VIGFLIKKSFWDFWDRMGLMVLINIGFLFLGAGGFFLITLLTGSAVLFYGGMFLLFVILGLYTGMSTGMIHDVIYHKPFKWSRFGYHLKQTAGRSLILFFGSLVFSFLVSTAFRFYFANAGYIVSLVAFFMVLWVSIFLMMAMMWFFPLFNLMGNPLKKHIKKCFLLTLDNTGLSIFMFIWTIILILLSGITVFLLPGFSAIILFFHNALKLLMYKYDYLEESEEHDRKNIPWRALLKTERDNLGQRGWSDFFRPGKLN